MNVSGIDLKALASSLRQVAAAPGANVRISVLIGVILLVAVLLLAAISALVVSSVSTRRRRARRTRLMARAVALKQRRAALARAASAGDETALEYLPTPEEILVAAKARVAEKRASAGSVTRSRKPMSRRAAVLVTWTGVAMILFVVAGTYVATGSDRYCSGTCHASSPAVAAATKDAHEAVACVACHEAPGVGGVVGALASRTRQAVMQVSGVTTGPVAPVPADRCLSCHAAKLATTVTSTSSGIRMSHSQVLAAGLRCSECHQAVGHGTVPVAGRMNVCVRCHNDRTAPARCSLCHTGDTGQAAAREQTFPTVVLGPVEDCGGCHAQTTCDNCHGIRMPHTTAFKQGGHARQGAFGGRTLCLRCHVLTDCGKCHDTSGANAAAGHPYWGHPADWKTDHKALPTTSSCSCHQARMPATLQGQPFCKLCH